MTLEALCAQQLRPLINTIISALIRNNEFLAFSFLSTGDQKIIAQLLSLFFTFSLITTWTSHLHFGTL